MEKAIGVNQVKTIISETGITAQDFAQLHHDLGWARTWYFSRKGLTALKKRQVKVGKIEKAARKLSSLLSAKDAWAAISSALADSKPPAPTVVKLIIKAAADYNKPIKQPAWATEASKRIRAELGMNTLSAFDWFVGVYLARVYERHFGQPAGRSRMNNGQVGGPYIRFVQAMLRESGILNRRKPYSRETIARAVSRARGSRNRIQRASKPSLKSRKRSLKSRKGSLRSKKRSLKSRKGSLKSRKRSRRRS
jgi:hypothetical protein